MPNTLLDGHWWTQNFHLLISENFQKKDEYGGSFMYHLEDNGQPLVAIGFIVSTGEKEEGKFKIYNRWPWTTGIHT